MSDFSDDISAVVIDLGSYNIRAGFAGDDAPREVIKSSTCSKKLSANSRLVSKFNQYVNNLEYLDFESVIDYPYNPVNGTDFNKLEILLNFCLYDSLKLKCDNLKMWPVLFSEPIFNEPKEREKLIEMMFESFSIPGYNVTATPILSLYASGRGSGIVVDSGHSITQTAVIYEGFLLPNSMSRVDIGGKDITNQLMSLTGNVYSFGQTNYLKNEYSFCPHHLDYIHKDQMNEMMLPDGTIVDIPKKYFSKCTDVMFDYSFCSKTGYGKGIHEMIYRSIMNCDVEIRKHLFCNIILSGANTLTNGFSEMVQSEFDGIFKFRHKNQQSKVVSHPERAYSTWIGGSILGSLCTFQTGGFVISREKYNENGAGVVNKSAI